MNREEVLREISDIADVRVREVEHTPHTRIVVTPEMVTLRPSRGSRVVEVAPEGVASMANFVGLTGEVASRLSPLLFARVAMELLQNRERYALMVKNDRVVGFHRTGEYRQLDPDRVLQTVEAGAGTADFHRVLSLPEYVVRLEVIATDRSQPVTRGDLIQAGAMVQFSPIGTVVPTVESFAMRLACTNGAVSNEVLRNFRFGGDGGSAGDFWPWLRRSVRDAVNSIDAIVARWHQMTGEEILPEDRARVLEGLIRNARLPKEAADAVRSRAIQEPPRNSYEAMQLLTWATSHAIDHRRNPMAVVRAQARAADFASEERHAMVCPLCHREN